ncbi:MAG: hypothetical protein Q9207_007293 [Kuettlingeria erythrocarpa]
MPRAGQKLSRRKCRRCRESKIKCAPVDRIWPDKCEACTKAGLPCSANLTASEAREEDLGASAAERTRPRAPAACSHAPTSKRSLNTHQSCTQPGGPLLSAVLEGHVAIVRLLLDAGVDVGERSETYGHSLEIASAQGHLEIVQLLLEFGADVDQAGVHHVNAVQASSIHGHAAVVQYLLNHRAKLSATARGARRPGPSLQASNTETIENRPQQQIVVGSPATHAQTQVHGPRRSRESPLITGYPQNRVHAGHGTATQRDTDGDDNASQGRDSLPSNRTSVSAVVTDDIIGSSDGDRPQLPVALWRFLNDPSEPEHYNRLERFSAPHDEYTNGWKGHDYSTPPPPDFVPQSPHHDTPSSPPAIHISEARPAHDAGIGVGILSSEPLTAPGRRPNPRAYEEPLLPPPTSPTGIYRCKYLACAAPPFQTQDLLE